MINVESQVYTPITVALREAFPGVDVSGEYMEAPSTFPRVSIMEQDNYPTLGHLDTSDKGQFATLMYGVNVYSNRLTGEKSQCRSIMRVVDDLVYQCNSTHISLSPVPNLKNASIYHLVARCRAETGGTNLYGR